LQVFLVKYFLETPALVIFFFNSKKIKKICVLHLLTFAESFMCMTFCWLKNIGSWLKFTNYTVRSFLISGKRQAKLCTTQASKDLLCSANTVGHYLGKQTLSFRSDYLMILCLILKQRIGFKPVVVVYVFLNSFIYMWDLLKISSLELKGNLLAVPKWIGL
jgi:hypothetical protein